MICLYHVDFPEGINFDPRVVSLLGPDWVDTPAKLAVVEESEAGASAPEQTTGNPEEDEDMPEEKRGRGRPKRG